MPSLQLDLPLALDVDAKRATARELGQVYAEVMEVAVELVTVSIHDLGAGGVWRCGEGEPSPAALVMCDVRIGRPVGTRALLARRIIAICSRIAGLPEEMVKVEFTQHRGDEMFHAHLGGFNQEWRPGEELPLGRATDPPADGR